jgi:hypothetical protein
MAGYAVVWPVYGMIGKAFWWGNLKETDHPEYLSVGEKIILEWTLGKGVGRCELDVSGSG